jgi:hypothetical protein
MFTIIRHVVDWNGELYIIKRDIKESTIHESLVQEYKEFVGADTVLRRNGHYFFVQKIEEAQLVEEEKIELDKPTEN